MDTIYYQNNSVLFKLSIDTMETISLYSPLETSLHYTFKSDEKRYERALKQLIDEFNNPHIFTISKKQWDRTYNLIKLKRIK